MIALKLPSREPLGGPREAQSSVFAPSVAHGRQQAKLGSVLVVLGLSSYDKLAHKRSGVVSQLCRSLQEELAGATREGGINTNSLGKCYSSLVVHAMLSHGARLCRASMFTPSGLAKMFTHRVCCSSHC